MDRRERWLFRDTANTMFAILSGKGQGWLFRDPI